MGREARIRRTAKRRQEIRGDEKRREEMRGEKMRQGKKPKKGPGKKRCDEKVRGEWGWRVDERYELTN